LINPFNFQLLILPISQARIDICERQTFVMPYNDLISLISIFSPPLSCGRELWDSYLKCYKSSGCYLMIRLQKAVTSILLAVCIGGIDKPDCHVRDTQLHIGMSYSKDQRGGLQSIVRKKLRLSVSQVTRNKILTTVSLEADPFLVKS
jgi:hypothetical protein